MFLGFKKKSPPARQPFISQDDMLMALDKEEETGLCSPLANIVAKEHLKGATQTTLFSQSNEEVYRRAVRVERHQDTIRQTDKSNGKHSAFLDTKTPFTVEKIPTGEPEKLTLDTLNQHNLITFPVEGTTQGDDAYHQIYFRREKTTCIKFDAKEPRGEKQGNCLELFNEFKKSIAANPDPSRPPKTVIVAKNLAFFPAVAVSEDLSPVVPQLHYQG